MSELEGWPWQPNLCPCDEYFIDLLSGERKEVLHGPIFHMGPGLHHRVGAYCGDHGLECYSITASQEEAKSKPDIENYHVILEDIYKFDPASLPEIQWMTLFHLGEMVDRFGPIQSDVIDRLVQRVPSGGKVYFYARSSTWDACAFQYLDPAVQRDIFIPIVRTYKSLVIMERT
jgi:hypothetical protein